MKKVLIYTDGSARGNPGPGGYGTLLLSGDNQKKLSGGFKKTTNNRMELMAVIMGLESLNQTCEVEVYSDSKYVINAMTRGWIIGWKSNGWAKKHKQILKNSDLWKRLDKAISLHSITWVWVKGHAGNRYNELCDQLATSAADKGDLPPDKAYIDAQSDENDLFSG